MERCEPEHVKEGALVSSMKHFYASVSHLSCPLMRPNELFYLSELAHCLLLITAWPLTFELLSVSGEIILEKYALLFLFLFLFPPSALFLPWKQTHLLADNCTESSLKV